MTTEEFGQWLKHHQTFFPDQVAWLKRQGNSQGILNLWAMRLSEVPANVAHAASVALYEAENRPRSYGDHPRWIERYAAEQKHKADLVAFARHGATHHCPLCFDSGWVTIFAVGQFFQRAVELYGIDRAAGITGAVACTCEAGPRGKIPRYDERQHVRARGSLRIVREMYPDDYQRRMEQVERGGEPEPEWQTAAAGVEF